MYLFYVIIFVVLIFFSAFFSSAETSLLSINRIRLNHKANKKNKKALLLTRILSTPDEFFSTILIGNNLVNIAAASISTIVFSKIFVGGEQVVLVVSTFVTTLIILVFAEVLPKSYAFRHSEKLSYIYAYPIDLFTFLFYPFVKALSFFSNLIFRRKLASKEKSELTAEEIKHFLATETRLIHDNPGALRVINEIIDTAGRGIKSLMTPRTSMIAIEEHSDIEALKKIILDKKVTKIPIYKGNLDHISGIIHSKSLTVALLSKNFKDLNLKEIAVKPLFLSEYSPLDYAVEEFKNHEVDIAVVLDEYGATIGLLTLNDIFREILGEIKIKNLPIRHIGKNLYMVQGSTLVEEVNTQLDLELPEKKDYTTMSGLFIYHFGKLPEDGQKVKIQNVMLTVHQMGRRKIDELQLILGSKN